MYSLYPKNKTKHKKTLIPSISVSKWNLGMFSRWNNIFNYNMNKLPDSVFLFVSNSVTMPLIICHYTSTDYKLLVPVPTVIEKQKLAANKQAY